MFSAIQSYLRKSASRGRTVERVGPFMVTITPSEENPYLNYAIPDDGAEPTDEEVAALIACFEKHRRTPRLEFIPQNAPAVEPALSAAGFASEGEIPLMVYDSTLPVTVMPLANGFELLVPVEDDDFMGLMTAQSRAFNGESAHADVAGIAHQRSFMDDGGISVYIRRTESRDPVGGGMCDVPHDNTRELVGVGVREMYRRQGIATVITQWLVQRAIETGTPTIFLMAASPVEARIYSRAGFKTVGEMLHTSRK